MSKNYFAFIDESGNSSQERYFGLGLLLVDDEIGDFYDSMKPFYDKAKDIARAQKTARIADLTKNAEYEQIAEIAKSTRNFELKFKYINSTNNTIYSSLLDNYFKFSNVRFCALVIDRQKHADNKSKWQPVINPWETYILQASMLIANNIKNISPCGICVLADDLTRPTNIKKSFERSLTDAIKYRLTKNKMPDSVFGVSRLESHSSLLLQVVDILLGCVMYDFKKSTGLISDKLSEKQEIVVDNLKQKLETSSLAQNKTYHKPSYFSVWELSK